MCVCVATELRSIQSVQFFFVTALLITQYNHVIVFKNGFFPFLNYDDDGDDDDHLKIMIFSLKLVKIFLFFLSISYQ